MTTEHTKEDQDDVHLIAFCMLHVAIISGRIITSLQNESEIKLDTCKGVSSFPMKLSKCLKQKKHPSKLL